MKWFRKDKRMTVDFQFECGVKVRDKITGLVGVITCQAIFINKCRRYSVQPPVDAKDPGTLPDSIWIDEDQIETLAAPQVQMPMKRTGGPFKTPRSLY